MRPPFNTLVVSQLFGGNPRVEAYTAEDGRYIIGHNGIDFACSEGDEVYPAYNGIIRVIESSTGYGLHVILHGDNGQTVLYGHLSHVDVPLDSRVRIHTPFAKAGSTGNSTGPHLHMGYRPAVYDSQNGYDGYIDFISSFDHDAIATIDLSRTNL